MVVDSSSTLQIVSQARLSITERESDQIQLRESFLVSQHTCLNDDEISCINESGTGRHTLICIRISIRVAMDTPTP